METVKLYCQIGDHHWDRPRQRGKRPLNCPEHRPEPVAAKVTIKRDKPQAAATETVTLWCETGEHNWERPRKRGKTPKNCPEHKPQVVVVQKPLAPVIDIDAVRDELAALSKRGQTVLSEYEQALEATRSAKTKDEIAHTFNVADNKQNMLLNISRRKETLTLQLQKVS